MLHKKTKDVENLVEHRVASESIFSGVLLKVYRDTVRLPDNNTTVREWIDHPGASAIVPLFEDHSTLLVEQFRYPVQQVMLEVPAGKRDGDEPFSESAQRELEEETGWQAGRLEHLGASFPVLGYSNEIIHFFLATQLSPGTAQKEDDEFIRVCRMPLEEAAALAQDGTILDMKSIVAIQRAQAYLREMK